MLLNPIILQFFPSGSDKELSFDREAFDKIKEEAQKTKEDIQNRREDVKRAVEELRKNWRTPAGRKFFENLDDNWTADITKFTQTMDAFIQVMEEVESQFCEIEKAVWQLQHMRRIV